MSEKSFPHESDTLISQHLVDDTNLKLNEIENIRNQSNIQVLQQTEASQMISIDPTKGFITLDSNSKLSTNALNVDNFYNLLVRLNQNDQLELNNSSLTSQFYLTPEELNSLLEPNEVYSFANNANFNNELDTNNKESLLNTSSNQITNSDYIDLSSDLSTFPYIKTDKFQCLEICCLLKIDASELNFT